MIISYVICVLPSICTIGITLLQIEGFFLKKIDISEFFEIMSRKFNIYEHLTRITGILPEYLWAFMIVFRLILLRMRNISDKAVEKIETHSYILSKFSENCTVWKNVVERDRPQII